jgi:transposase
MVRVEQWAEIRRLYFVKGLSIKEIARRTGRDRNTIRKALRSERPPKYSRPTRPSKLDPFKEEIHRLLGAEPRLPGTRVRELIAEQGYVGSKTILDDYLREVRPLFLPRPRTFQRTSYRPAALCQFDLWEPSREIPVGAGQTRRGYVVVACPPYSRAGAGTLVFSKEAPDILAGVWRCLGRLGALPKTLGLRPRGRAARRRWAAVGAVRALLRPAAGGQAHLRTRRRAGQGPGRAADRLSRDELRARP